MRVKSFPCLESKRPTTFSRTITGICRLFFLSSWIILQKPQNEPLLSASRPLPLPARDKSWQGKEAQAKVGLPGIIDGSIFHTSSTCNSEALAKFSRYAAAFFGEKSFANVHSQFFPRPRRARPPPAKNSRNSSLLSEELMKFFITSKRLWSFNIKIQDVGYLHL